MPSLYYLTSTPFRAAPDWVPLAEAVTREGWTATLTVDDNPRVLAIEVPDHVMSYGQVARWVATTAEELGIDVVPTDAGREPGSPWGAYTPEQRLRALESARAISHAATRGLNWELRRVAGEISPRPDDRPAQEVGL